MRNKYVVIANRSDAELWAKWECGTTLNPESLIIESEQFHPFVVCNVFGDKVFTNLGAASRASMHVSSIVFYCKGQIGESAGSSIFVETVRK